MSTDPCLLARSLLADEGFCADPRRPLVENALQHYCRNTYKRSVADIQRAQAVLLESLKVAVGAARLERLHVAAADDGLPARKRARFEDEDDETRRLRAAIVDLQGVVGAAEARLQATYDRRVATERRVLAGECNTMEAELEREQGRCQAMCDQWCTMREELGGAEARCRALQAEKDDLSRSLTDEQAKSRLVARALASLQPNAPPAPTLADVYERIVRKLSQKYEEGCAAAIDKQHDPEAPHAWLVETDEGAIPLRAGCLLNTLAEVRHRAASGMPLGWSPGHVWLAIYCAGSHVYDVEFVSETKAIQINNKTGKRRDIVYAPFSGNGAPIEMNGFAIPCHDGTNFLLAEEYADLRHLVAWAPRQTECTPAFDSLSSVFASVFSGENDTFKSSFLHAECLYNFARRACARKNNVIRIVAHGTTHANEIGTHGFDVSHSKGGPQGKGIYVSQNDYIPRTWAKERRSRAPASDASPRAVVLGALVDVHEDDRRMSEIEAVVRVSEIEVVVPYRMNTRGGEPAGWKERDVQHAMCVRSVEHAGLVALGACWM